MFSQKSVCFLKYILSFVNIEIYNIYIYIHIYKDRSGFKLQMNGLCLDCFMKSLSDTCSQKLLSHS